MKKKITRRQFSKSAGAGIALFNIVPRYVLGGRGHIPPSEMVRLAGIGLRQGLWDLQRVAGTGKKPIPEEAGKRKAVTAICDVDQGKLVQGARRFPEAKQYTDYRKMLDEEGDRIDAVVIGTPDHSHAMITLDTMRRGKHIYCEKPLAHSINEVRTLISEAKKHNVVTQLGNQGHSSERIHQLCEWVWDGAIGNIHEVRVSNDYKVDGNPRSNYYCRIDDLEKLQEHHDVPEELNWDLWLEPAKKYNYHPLFHPGIWRGWTPFGTGRIGDWFCHIVDPVYWALDLGYPTSICATNVDGYDPVKHNMTFPSGATVVYEFPAKGKRGPVKLVWNEGAILMERPEMLEEGRTPPTNGAVLIGDNGAIKHGSHGAKEMRIIPEKRMQEYAPNMPEPTLPRIPGGDHWQEFIHAIKEGRKANSDFTDYGGPLTECALLGSLAMRFPGDKLLYDAENARFTNHDGANKLINPPL